MPTTSTTTARGAGPLRRRALAAVAAAACLTTLVGGAAPAGAATGAARRLWFVRGSDTAGHLSLWSAAPDGTGMRQVYAGVDVRVPAPTADGSRIAFSGLDSSGRGSIYVVNGDGTGATRWTAPTTRYSDWFPAWLPGGGVVFTRYDLATGQGALYVKPGPAGSAVRLPVTGDAVAPTVSPDGRYLAFARDGALVVTRLDGSAPWTLLTRAVGAQRPSWSPDGRRIAYVTATAVQVVDVATGQGYAVADYPRGTVFRATWRDDGWRLDYAVGRHTPYGDTANLYEASFDGLVAPHALTADDSFGWQNLDPWPSGGTGPVPDLTAPPAPELTASVTATSAKLTVAGGSDTARRIVRVATGATPPATPADGSAGYDGLAPGTTLPLVPGTQYSIAAWLVDWAGNVGPPATRTFTAPDATSLSVAVAPDPVTYGSTVTVSGTLRDVTAGAPLAGRTVTLDGVRPFTSPSTRTVTTDAQGHYSLTFTVRYATKVTASFAAAAGHARAYAAAPLHVREYVTARLADATVRAGSTVTVYATAKPNPAAGLEAYYAGRWRAVGYASPGSTADSYVMHWVDVPRGTYRLRVRGQGNGYAAAAGSPVVSVTAS